LNAALPSGSAGSISQLKYKVVNEGAVAVNAVSSVKLANSSTVTSDGSTGVKTAAAASAGATATVYVAGTAHSTNGADPDTYTEPTSTSLNSLALSLDAFDADTKTQTVVVTAFLDSVANGTLDSGEWKTTKTITFVKYSELTTSGAIDKVSVADDAVSGALKFTNVNNELLDEADVTVLVTKGDGTNFGANNAADTLDVAAWDATDGFVFDYANLPGTGSPVKGSAVKAQPYFAGTKTGTALVAEVVTVTVDSVNVTAVKSTTMTAGGTFKTNSTFKVQVEVLDADEAAVAGTPVTVKVAFSGDVTELSSTKTLAVNGTTYSSNSSLPGQTGVAKLAAGSTDKDGLVTLTFTTTGAGDADQVTVTAYAETKEDATTFTADDAYYEAYLTNVPDWTAVTTDGKSVDAAITVKDQYGALAPDATFEVNATLDASSQVPAATSASNTFQTVSGGKATLSITDNGTGTGTNTYLLKLWKKATNGQSTLDHQFAVLDINIVDAVDAVSGKIVLTDATAGTDGVYTNDSGDGRSVATGLTLATKDFANFDYFNLEKDAPAVDGDVATISGIIKSAASSTHAAIAIPNAPITISGAGLQFQAQNIWNSDEDNYALRGDGSLTVNAEYDGAFSVTVRGHLAGKQTVTITSGSVSVKVYVYFDVVVGDGASQFQAGRALDVSFKVTDKFGNPVALTGTAGLNAGKLVIAQTGAGYLASTGDGTTSATGGFATKLITNFGDLGTSNITATVDFDNSTTLMDLTAVNATEFGLSDADVTVGGKAVYASVEFAKGKTVTVTVDGKRLYSKLASTDNYTELKFTQKKAGVHTVTVRVSGGLVVTERVVTTK
jgi:hypothetical protein